MTGRRYLRLSCVQHLSPTTDHLQPTITNVIGTFTATDHVSMSDDSKIRPAAVWANRRAPSGENHTRLTGPVAGDASARSTVKLPIRRQFGREKLAVAGVCAIAGIAKDNNPEMAASQPPCVAL